MTRKINNESEFRIIRMRTRDFLLKEKPYDEIENFEMNTDCKLRVLEFSGFSKAKCNRYLREIDKQVIALTDEYEINLIEKMEYNQEIMVLQIMLLSLLDYINNCEWKISKNWIIQ